jgi:glyoxylase-like metal-dependent hydrolase (beta-lactamase superfamily II)/8-oxo-dGTP pyrophosphatase MutT (NUDIX family)
MRREPPWPRGGRRQETPMTTVHQTPPDARRAASLMFLRDAPSGAAGGTGLEVLMLRRAERDGDLRSGAIVFPGGVLDEADRHAHHFVLGPDDAAASARLGLPAGGLDYLVAAVRESFEEVGLLLVCAPDGGPADLDGHAATLASWRLKLQQGQGTLAELCAALDLRLDLRALHYHSHWLTPPGVPKRFDTRFFTVLAPAGQVPMPDLGEAVELMWTTPAAALASDSGYKLLPVTRETLKGLAGFATAAAAHAEAGARTDVPLVMPRRGRARDGSLRIVLPWDHAYAELSRLDPTGSAPPLADIVPGTPVRLSPRIVRVTAPNPGMMTGPGTNSYLVGDPDGAGWALIDPGPDIPAHRDALLAAAAGRPITHVIATHTHVDHSPGAATLARATGAAVWGRRAPPHAGQDHGFAPDHEPADGERLPLGPTTTLRAIHTPGHASNHLCWLLEQEELLFTGDQVMQGSTVVINPPDGDMGAYLRSLQGLLALDLAWFAPGHGFLVREPHKLLRALIAHRLAREAKVVDALRAAGEATVEALVARVYDDVPSERHGVAARSLLAHLVKLHADGRAAELQGRWRPIG